MSLIEHSDSVFFATCVLLGEIVLYNTGVVKGECKSGTEDQAYHSAVLRTCFCFRIYPCLTSVVGG